jgi:hypothetical protein
MAVCWQPLLRNLKTTVGPVLLQYKVFVIVSFDEKMFFAAQKSKHRESWAMWKFAFLFLTTPP